MKKLLFIPIAFLCVLISPFMLWSAENQNRAKDFQSAKEVKINSEEEGYVLLEGEAELERPLTCPKNDSNECIFITQTIETYEVSEEKICTETKPEESSITKILPQECDNNGKCIPCYMVEKKEWVAGESASEFSKFTIGDYKITTKSGAKFIGLENYTHDLESIVESDEYYFDDYDYFYEEFSDEGSTSDEEIGYQTGDQRIKYSYLVNEGSIIVAGEARNGEISEGDETFVISNLTYSETLNALESQDASAKWGLRILSLLLIVGGFVFIAGALASVPLTATKLIPVVGDKLNSSLSTMVTLGAAVVAVIVWLLIFLVVFLLKNILALAIMMLISLIFVVALFALVTKMRNKKEV